MSLNIFGKISETLFHTSKYVVALTITVAVFASAEVVRTKVFTGKAKIDSPATEDSEFPENDSAQGNRAPSSLRNPTQLRPALSSPGATYSSGFGDSPLPPRDDNSFGQSTSGYSVFADSSGEAESMGSSALSSAILADIPKAKTKTDAPVQSTAETGGTGYGGSPSAGTGTATSTSTSTSTTTTIAAPSALSYSSTPVIYLTGSAITGNSPTVTGAVTSYSVSPSLPAGLGLDTTSGLITGTPTATVAATNYTVTASNSSGSTTALVNIRTGPGFQVDSLTDADDAALGDGVCATAGGVCTLRAAIREANALGGVTNRMILVPAGTITLGGSEIVLDSNIEVIGSSQTLTIVNANALSRIFNASAHHTYTYAITKLTLKNGNAGGANGGCVYALGNYWTLSAVTITGCITGAGGWGGGFYVFDEWGSDTASLTMSNCTVSNNTSSVTGGGVIFSATLAGDTFAISNSSFTSNTATNNAGGLALQAPTGTFSGNLVDSNSVNVANGGAGGMYITPGTYTFTNNTISQNTGGGIGTNNGTILTLINNTFANNTTPNNGQYFGGAGLQMNGGGVPTLQNNIFFNNLFNVTKSNCAMPAGSTLGGNVSDTIAAECGTTDGTDRNSVSAVLSALADNGGPTHTMALNAGSPGVDAGVNAGCPTTDQRGYTRPVNGTCDSGAFERQ